MPDTITSCVEEEYSLFLSFLWRRKSGWRPQFMYFRGPASIPFFIVPILTLVGWWRFSRRPIRLADADPASWRDATVSRTSSLLGSYGMGGPGFVGVRVRPPGGRSTWIVFTLWAAAEWLTLNDDLVADGYFPDDQRELAGTRRFRPLSDLEGATLTDIRLEHENAELSFRGKREPLVLRLRRDSSTLPVHRGSKKPKVLAASQDIRDAVVVSRRGFLWLDE